MPIEKARPNERRSTNCERTIMKCKIQTQDGKQKLPLNQTPKPFSCHETNHRLNLMPTLPSALCLSSSLAVNQCHHFRTAGDVGTEYAFHCRCNAYAARLAYAANRHAGMRSFDHYRHAFGIEFLHQQIGNVFRQSLLHLRSLRNNFHHARQFAEPDHAAIGNIRDVGMAHEWQQMMFTDTVEGDVAN